MSVNTEEFLWEMYKDSYFPNSVVDKGKALLLDLNKEIEEAQPKTAQDLYVLSHKTTESFNDLQDDFEDAGSEIETAARESIAASIGLILDSTGIEYDLEEAIATRDW